MTSTVVTTVSVRMPRSSPTAQELKPNGFPPSRERDELTEVRSAPQRSLKPRPYRPGDARIRV